MKAVRLFLIPTATALLLGGCVQQKYSWGHYDTALYSYYQNGGSAADYQKALESAMRDSEITHKPVAPGIYAEYGHLLMQQKRNADAVAYFEKEKQAWPESSRFMDAMIKTASQAPTSVAAQAPAETAAATGGQQ